MQRLTQYSNDLLKKCKVVCSKGGVRKNLQPCSKQANLKSYVNILDLREIFVWDKGTSGKVQSPYWAKHVPWVYPLNKTSTFKREKGKMSMVRFALCKILLGVQGGALH